MHYRRTGAGILIPYLSQRSVAVIILALLLAFFWSGCGSHEVNKRAVELLESAVSNPLLSKEEVLVIVNEALRIDSEYALAYEARGSVYESLGRESRAHGNSVAADNYFMKAINDYKKAMSIEKQPNDLAKYSLDLSGPLIELGRYDEAERILAGIKLEGVSTELAGIIKDRLKRVRLLKSGSIPSSRPPSMSAPPPIPP